MLAILNKSMSMFDYLSFFPHLLPGLGINTELLPLYLLVLQIRAGNQDPGGRATQDRRRGLQAGRERQDRGKSHSCT